MKIIVQKYGGSSLSDLEKLNKVAEKIISKKEEGYNIVVVVSAMGKSTNELIGMAKRSSENPDKRELDMLLSAGERISMSLLCIKLIDKGYKAVSLTGSQAGIITNDCNTDAKVIEVRPFRIQDELRNGKIVVVGGFQGVSYKRDITTLGRGGSDTSAVAISAALEAEYCEIYSDVAGIFSADPNVLNSSKHLPEISYELMQEMGMAGAKVLNSKAVEFAKKSDIAIYARSTFGSGQETVIRKISKGKLSFVKSVVYENDIEHVLVSEKNNQTIISKILKLINEKKIQMKELNIVNRNVNSNGKASFVISTKENYEWNIVKCELLKDYSRSLSITEEISALSIIGDGINRNHFILNKTLELLSENNITYIGISTTSFRISVLINQENTVKALKLLHKFWIEKI